MAVEKEISNTLMQLIEAEISLNNNWVAYNTLSYVLEMGDMYFFRDKEDALDFAESNQSDYDYFRVLGVQSVEDLLDQFHIKETFNKKFDEAYTVENSNDDSNSLIEDNLKNRRICYLSKNIKTNIMNTQNLDYLKDNLKYLGFGEKLYPELEKNIQQGSPEFSLKLQNEYNKDKMEAQLHFRRSDQSDMYFFNRYDAKIASDKNDHSQTFYLNKGYGVTLKEAYNLLSGRSINKDLMNKEGQLYNAWVQLDFKESDDKGNFKMKQYHQMLCSRNFLMP